MLNDVACFQSIATDRLLCGYLAICVDGSGNVTADANTTDQSDTKSGIGRKSH
jgi:hypothetical protein